MKHFYYLLFVFFLSCTLEDRFISDSLIRESWVITDVYYLNKKIELNEKKFQIKRNGETQHTLNFSGNGYVSISCLSTFFTNARWSFEKDTLRFFTDSSHYNKPYNLRISGDVTSVLVVDAAQKIILDSLAQIDSIEQLKLNAYDSMCKRESANAMKLLSAPFTVEFNNGLILRSKTTYIKAKRNDLYDHLFDF